MEKYFKDIEDGYITAICTGGGDIEITQEEYENILSVVKDRPTPEQGYDYRLKEDLTWELIEVEIIIEDEIEISDDEFMNMLEEVL